MAREVGEYLGVSRDPGESSASGRREQAPFIKYHYKGDEDEPPKVSIESGSMEGCWQLI